MRKSTSTQAVSLLLCSLLASPMFSPLSAAPGVAVLGQIVSGSPARLNGVRIPSETTLFNGDRVSTGPEGWARVFLSPGEQIHLGAQSAARARRTRNGIAVELEEGQVALQTHGSNRVVVRSNGLEMRAGASGEAVWEVRRLSETLTEVAALEGSVEVRAVNRTVEVPAGHTARLETRLVQNAPSGTYPDTDRHGAVKAALLTLLITAGVVAAVLIPVSIARGGGAPVSPSGIP